MLRDDIVYEPNISDLDLKAALNQLYKLLVVVWPGLVADRVANLTYPISDTMLASATKR
jgi:hypothetical protein